MLLLTSGKKCRRINQSQDGDIETVTEADKPGSFFGRIDLEGTCHMLALVCYDPDCLSGQTRKTNYKVPCEACLYLQKTAGIH